MDELISIRCGIVEKQHEKEFKLNSNFSKSELERWLTVMLTYHINCSVLSKAIETNFDSLTLQSFTSIVTLIHISIQLNINKLVLAGMSLKKALLVDTTKLPFYNEITGVLNRIATISSSTYELLEEIISANKIETFEELYDFFNNAKDLFESKGQPIDDILDGFKQNAFTYTCSKSTSSSTPLSDPKQILEYLLYFETHDLFHNIIKKFNLYEKYKTFSVGTKTYTSDIQSLYAIEFFRSFVNEEIASLDEFDNMHDVMEYFLHYGSKAFDINEFK